MYVLFITMGYPTAEYVGNGIFEFDQAKALTKLNCKVIYAFVDVRSIRRWRKWGYERKTIDGVEIYGINIPLGRVPHTFLDKASVSGLKYVYKKVVNEQGKPDILHAHFTDLGYISVPLKEKTNIPLVITEHSSLINKDVIEENLYKKASAAYKNADALIAVSPSLAEKIKENFGAEPIYIPNIVDTEIFSYSKKLPHDNFNFVSIGNLIHLKRIDLLIDAFNRAFSGNTNVTLTIFGDGPERSRLQDMINKYNLNDNVFLKGFCLRDVIADKLSESDCFVLASQTETFGVAYIEALSMGIPVIATKCGGPQGFVNNENGVMVEVDDVNGLTEAMKYMYKNADKFDGESISKVTKSLFSPESVGSRLMEVYKSVINRK